MRRLAVAVLLAAGVVAPVRSSAFVRSTTCTNQPRKGQCLWWNTRTLAYAVNASAFAPNPACASADAASRLVNQSLPTWDLATRTGDAAPCTDLQFTGGASTSEQGIGLDGTNLVVFRRGLCRSITSDPDCQKPEKELGACIKKYNCWGHGTSSSPSAIIALTLTTFDVATGRILDADIELHGWNGEPNASGAAAEGWYFTCDARPPSRSSCAGAYDASKCMDIGNTVTHEAGHVLGLDHTCFYPDVPCTETAATMAATASAGETSKRVLKQDDVNGVCTIYPAGAPVDAKTGCLGDGKTYDSTDCVSERPADAGSSSGCGAGSGGLPSLVAGLLALRRLGRRGPQRTTAPA